MKRLVTSHTLGKQVCEALGIDPSGVRSLTLKMKADDLAIVEIVRFIEVDEAGRLIETCSEYRLVEQPPEVKTV